MNLLVETARFEYQFLVLYQKNQEILTDFGVQKTFQDPMNLIYYHIGKPVLVEIFAYFPAENSFKDHFNPLKQFLQLKEIAFDLLPFFLNMKELIH
jgi:hypothetical protein